MGYRIYHAASHGLCVEGRENILKFMNELAKAMPVEQPDGNASTELEFILDEKDVYRKACRLSMWAQKFHCPFDLQADEDLLEAYYDESGYGEYWHEDRTVAFLKTIAPYVQKDSYVGFIGEDQSMWSYVFDGQGGFEYRVPELDWTCGKNRDDGLLAERLLSHLGHRVQIALYGDPDDPICVTLEDLDTNEIVLDSEIYTLVPRKDIL